MAGTISGQSKTTPDVLFNLTPDDDITLAEADLLQLVNYGQLQKPVKIPGTDGRVYTVDMALLWDEDYIDLFRLTSGYANDPVLRVRIMRRLKVHKAIQRIDTHDYSNKEDPVAQRQLWTILTKLSDKQMELLSVQYDHIELERNLQITAGVKNMADMLDTPITSSIKQTPEEQGIAHEELFRQNKQDQEDIADVINEHILGVDYKTQPEKDTGNTIPTMQIGTPRQERD